MADSKLQREYTLAAALVDIAIGATQNDAAKVERASEWVGTLVADLEKKVGYLEHLLTARMRNESQPAPDSFQRCDVSVPKQCVLQRGHGGHSHVSNSGTMWPVRPDGPFGGVTPLPMEVPSELVPDAPPEMAEFVQAKLAPDHLPEGRLVRDDEPRCPVRRERDHIPNALCARQWNHGGPHMDRTAIAHAGNAGEVWE